MFGEREKLVAVIVEVGKKEGTGDVVQGFVAFDYVEGKGIEYCCEKM